MGAHRGELGGASLVRFLAENIVGYLGGKWGEMGGNSFVSPPNVSRFTSGGGEIRACIVNSIFFRELGKVLASNLGRKNSAYHDEL